MPTIPDSSAFLTVKEAARILHLSPTTVYDRIYAGELDAIKVGSGPKAPVRIAPADLLLYLQRVNGEG